MDHSFPQKHVIQSMAHEVLEVCGDKSIFEITVDLEKTGSVELTINRIFDGTGTILDSYDTIILSDDDNQIEYKMPDVTRSQSSFLDAIPSSLSSDEDCIFYDLTASQSYSNTAQNSGKFDRQLETRKRKYSILGESSNSGKDSDLFNNDNLNNMKTYESPEEDDLPSPDQLLTLPSLQTVFPGNSISLTMHENSTSVNFKRQLPEFDEVIDIEDSQITQWIPKEMPISTCKGVGHKPDSPKSKLHSKELNNEGAFYLQSNERTQSRDEVKKLKELAKLEKKLQRESEKNAKNEKEQEKMAKNLEKENSENYDANRSRMKKKDFTKEIIVDIEGTLLTSSVGLRIEKCLKAKLCEINIMDIPCPTNTIRWRRRALREKGIQNLAHKEILVENHLLTYLDAQGFFALIKEPEGLARHINNLKTIFPQQKLIYLIEGIDPYLKKRKLLKNRNFQKVVRLGLAQEEEISLSQHQRKGPFQQGDDDFLATGPGKEQIEEELIWMQIVAGCLIVHTNDQIETAEWIGILTTDIASIPYRNRDGYLSSWAHNRIQSGKDASDTFRKVLQEIQLVTLPVANGILESYGTIQSLYEGWDCCNTVNKAEMMLADIKVSRASNRPSYINKALSKKLYIVFNEKNPDISIV